MSDADLRAITVDYTIEFASSRSSSPDAAFSFLSGSGADRRDRAEWLSLVTRERLRRHSLRRGSRTLHLPARLHLPSGAAPGTDISYRLLRWIYPLFRTLFPNQVIRADDLARAMVDVIVLGTAEGPIFENRDIRTMVQSLHPPWTDQRKVAYRMSGSFIGLRSSWRRARKQLSEALPILQARVALAKANEDLKTAQAELQRRWQYLAEAQRLSHSGTFGWKVSNGELVLLHESTKTR